MGKIIPFPLPDSRVMFCRVLGEAR